VIVGAQTVPDRLLGCWRRNWIRFGDGDRETDVAVIWLQTASGMGDIRIDPRQQPHETDSSCGITVVDETTSPFPTAVWLDGDTGFSQQAVSSFPEKGWLDWQDDTILFERAPSGAYVEEWEMLDGSMGVVEHHVARGTSSRVNRYTAGCHVMLAVERSSNEAVHEYSYGIRASSDGPTTIQLSTHAKRIGQAMDLDFDWELISSRRHSS